MEEKVKIFINVIQENDVYKVPASFVDGLHLVPMPDGKMYLSFFDKKRMKKFVEKSGFTLHIEHPSSSIKR